MIAHLFKAHGENLTYIDVTFEKTAGGIRVSAEGPAKFKTIIGEDAIGKVVPEGLKQAREMFDKVNKCTAQEQGRFVSLDQKNTEQKVTWQLCLSVKP